MIATRGFLTVGGVYNASPDLLAGLRGMLLLKRRGEERVRKFLDPPPDQQHTDMKTRDSHTS